MSCCCCTGGPEWRTALRQSNEVMRIRLDELERQMKALNMSRAARRRASRPRPERPAVPKRKKRKR